MLISRHEAMTKDDRFLIYLRQSLTPFLALAGIANPHVLMLTPPPPPQAQRPETSEQNSLVPERTLLNGPRLTIGECAIMIAVAAAISVGIGLLSGLSLVEALHLLKLA